MLIDCVVYETLEHSASAPFWSLFKHAIPEKISLVYFALIMEYRYRYNHAVCLLPIRKYVN